MLRKTRFLSFVAASLVTSWVHADAGCDQNFTAVYHESLRIVDSIRADKPGLARVYAVDGSEYTAGQASWMKGQMRLVNKACARGDQTGATRILSGVQQLLKAHHSGAGV